MTAEIISSYLRMIGRNFSISHLEKMMIYIYFEEKRMESQ